jgi:uncharacterized membrane protein
MKELSLTTAFTALYAAAVISLTSISFNILQVRVADAMLPLAILFGWPAIMGVTLGAVISNFFGGLGIIDILGGAIANFAATLLGWKIGCTRLKGSWLYATTVEILTVTLVVGSYLSYIFNVPLATGLLLVLVGSVIAIGLLGYLLLRAISKPMIVGVLRSRGIKLYLRRKD